MSDLRAAAQQALEALTPFVRGNWTPGLAVQAAAAIDRLKAALVEPVQEPVQEPVAFMDAPERIYLQVCEDDHCEVPFHEHDEKTWCITKQNPLDVPYVRADLAAPPQAAQEQPTCDECGRKKADGWALYCVDCLEPMFAQRKPLTEEEIDCATARQWCSLTDDEIKEIVGPWGDTPIKGYTRKLFDQIEAKLREKNT